MHPALHTTSRVQPTAGTAKAVGIMSTQMNPLFISDGGANSPGGAGSGRATGTQSLSAIAATIAAQSDAPPPELWRVFQVRYELV